MKHDVSPTTKGILQLLGVGAIVVITITVPTIPMTLNFISKAWKKYNKKDLGRIIKRFIKQEVISISEENGEQVIKLTEKGRTRLLKYNFDDLSIKAKKRDGLFRIIIFDIPEDLKKNRELFRQKLIELGFTRIQDSVFASAFPCKDEIDFICNYLEISRFVTLFSVKSIERGEELIFQRFNQRLD